MENARMLYRSLEVGKLLNKKRQDQLEQVSAQSNAPMFRIISSELSEDRHDKSEEKDQNDSFHEQEEEEEEEKVDLTPNKLRNTLKK